MKTFVELTQGYFALIDEVDLERVKKHSWCIHKTKNSLYAQSRINKRKIYLHRFILNITDKPMYRVDHIDGNGLNNTRSNLRICSHKENSRGQRKIRKSSSKYKGVTFLKDEEIWVAQIKVNYRTINLGRFKSERTAALAYNKAALKYFGKFARINSL